MWLDQPILKVAQAINGLTTVLDRQLTKWYNLVEPALRVRVTTPGHVTYRVVSQVSVPISTGGFRTMFKFQFTLPVIDTADPKNKDIAVRKFTVSIAGGAPITLDVPPSFDPASPMVVDNDLFLGDLNAAVVTTLQDVDGSGNASPVVTDNFVVVDNVAPAEPGHVGMATTQQL